MIIWKIGFTLDFEIIFLIPAVWVYAQAGGHLSYSNIKSGKSNTSTFFEIMRVHPYIQSLAMAVKGIFSSKFSKTVKIIEGFFCLKIN